MILEGADLPDIGGYSSRPGATHISEEEEASRVLPAIERIHRAFPHIPISIDTFRASIAQRGIAAGASIINDITGEGDQEMFSTVSNLPCTIHYDAHAGTPKR